MPTVTEHLRRSLLRNVPDAMPDLAELRRTERNPEFRRLCDNRLVMGAFRYGRFGAPDKPTFDRIGYAIAKLQAYRQTRNAECLVDAANACELEFAEGQHNGVIPADDADHAKEV